MSLHGLSAPAAGATNSVQDGRGVAAIPALSVGRIRAARTLAEFRDLWPRTDWSGSSASYAFQRVEALAIWCETMGAARGTEPWFVVVEDAAGQPWLGLALGIERSRGIRVLTFLDGGVGDYNAPVLFQPDRSSKPVLLGELVRHLRDVLPPFDLASFEKMPEFVIDRPNPLVGPDLEATKPWAHSLTLSGTWEQWLSSLPRATAMRKRRRKLERTGKLRLVFPHDHETRERMFGFLVEHKRRRYILTRGWDGFKRPGYLAYYRAMVERLGPASQLCALMLDETMIAAHWGMVLEGRFYSLMPAFDDAWAKQSPGRLINEDLIAWSFRNGLSDFDFTVGDEAYKLEYCDREMRLYRSEMAITLRGRMYLAVKTVYLRFKRSKVADWLRVLRVRLRAAVGGEP